MTSLEENEEVRIRTARMEDSASLARLAGQLGHLTTPEQVAARFEDATREPDCAAFVAELPSGELAGFMELMQERLLYVEPRVDVTGLVVDDAHRGTGVGRMLMARAEQWALDRGCHLVHLRTNVKRAGAHAFYERLGYRHTKTQKTFVKYLDDRK
jgi:GNAT superfamily N-acetyltransferase